MLYKLLTLLQRGQIVDPPIEVTARLQPSFTRHARSPTPDMPAHLEPRFCERCQRNHLIVNKALAEYLPEPDDPDYAKYEATLSDYQAQLEERYPPVCEKCIANVQAGIRQAGYTAKADDLRRKLDQSRMHLNAQHTAGQRFKLVLVFLAKWAYLASVLVRLSWHVFGAITYFGSAFEHDLSVLQCLSEAVFLRNVVMSCAVSPVAGHMVLYALVADALTVWWNPRLSQIVTSANGRMRNRAMLWILRLMLLLLDIGAYLALGVHSVENDYMLDEVSQGFFHTTHRVLLGVQFIGTLIGWRMITVTYFTAKTFKRPVDEYMPTAAHTPEKGARARPQIERPNNTIFDSMAEGLSSSFPTEPNAYPPSPTLTNVSVTETIDSEATPFRRRKSSTPMTFGDENMMDWTPTQPRFSTNPPPLIQPKFGRAAEDREPSAAPDPSPVSIFSGLDQNPFRRRVPAAPKAPAAAKVDPWRKPPWAPPFEERKRNFFEEDKQMNQDLGTGLKGRGVPKRVEREAELFAAPKFKYDSYGKAKNTGLEDSFGSLFSDP